MTDEQKSRVGMWVAALRSGAYVQGWGRLAQLGDKGGLRHCCLGVACDVHATATGGMWGPHDLFMRYRGEPKALPLDVAAWYGLAAIDPTLLRYPNDDGRPFEVLTAITANDTVRWSFDEIADAIERTYLDEQAAKPQPQEVTLG